MTVLFIIPSEAVYHPERSDREASPEGKDLASEEPRTNPEILRPKNRPQDDKQGQPRDPSIAALARDDNEGFVILSECEGSLGWVSPESKPRSFGHDTGLRMTNKGKPEIPRSLRSFGTTNINGLFGTTTKALSSRGRTHEKSGESPAVAGSSPLLNGLFLWSVSVLNT